MNYIISFKVSSDRLSLFTDLLTGEGISVTIRAESPESKAQSPKPSITRHKDEARTLPEIIWSNLTENSGTSVQAIERLIIGMGFAEKSATSTLARLKQAGFVERDALGQWHRTKKPFNKAAIVYNKPKAAVE